jgi:hypothetical protein
VSLICSQCSKPLAAGAQFCGDCGTRVAAGEPDPANRIRELVQKAMAVTAADREAWLWQACEYNEPLFQEARALLPTATTAAPKGNTTGPYIGPYKLLRELGRGGMGVVHLAVRDDGAFRKNVAIKLLLRENVTPEFVLRFKQERQVLAALDHPNIARILDGGDAPDGMPFYVMEYVEGQPVDAYCDAQRLSLTGRIKIFQQICQAVQYLHQNSILHRDLKPANILVSSDGIVKLLDFGIAKLLGAGSFTNSDVTSVHGQMMTPGYASPEQLNGQPLQAASDIYALGTILYFLLTGRSPFSGYEEKMAKTATRQGPVPPSANIRQDLQATESTAHLRRAMLGELDSIVLKAMRVDPRDRYASAAELATDLQRFLDGEPVTAHRESVAQRSLRFLRRGRVAIAAALVVLLLAGAGAWQWQRSQTEKAAVSSRETQLRELLEQMEKRLDAAKDHAPLVADVGTVRKAFAADYPAIVARRSPDSGTLMTRAIRYYDRVQAVAPGTPALGIELADAYQGLGILQEPASPDAAVETYRKAAVTLASCPAEAPVLERMAMLRERVQKLGGALEETASAPATVTPAPVAPATVSPAAGDPAPKPAAPPPVSFSKTEPRPAARPEPRATVPPPATPVVATPPPPRGLSAAVLSELQDDLDGAENRIRIAEAAYAPIIANLERQGQTLNSDTLTTMARMKATLEKGRREMDGGDAANAKESFRIARALADKVLRSVGR